MKSKRGCMHRLKYNPGPQWLISDLFQILTYVNSQAVNRKEDILVSICYPDMQ